MQNDPTQGGQNTAANHPAHQEAANENNKYSDSADKEEKKNEEKVVEDESIEEDYEKFDVDKVDNFKENKNSNQN